MTVHQTVLSPQLNLQLGLIGGGVSLAACLAMVIMSRMRSGVKPRRHGGPQQIHDKEVFRLGGLAILLGLLAQFVLVFPRSHELLLATACILPLAMAGIAEDITNRVSAWLRLALSVLSATLLVMAGGHVITAVGFWPVDYLLAMPAVAVFLSVLAIATSCHAINIIDGLNGLAGGTSMLCLGAIALAAHGQGDQMLAFMAVWVMLPLAGFLVFNFPRGMIFLGDGGAYFLGALVGALVIAMPTRNVDISSFASLLVVAYPVYETIRSYVRRSLGSGAALMEPDGKHLHSRVFELFRRRLEWPAYRVNAAASLVVLALPAFCAAVAVVFHNQVAMLMLGLAVMVACYEALMRFVQKRL